MWAWPLLSWLFVLFVLCQQPHDRPQQTAQAWREFDDNPGSEACLEAHMPNSRWKKSERVMMGGPRGVYMRMDELPGVVFHNCIDGTYEMNLLAQH